MEIRFTKKTENHHIISCKRKNGTETWMNISSFFIIHDLCHFAVEKTLGLKKAFYGMLSSGTDISNFELPKEQRNFLLTEEAVHAEHLVNLFAIEYTQGKMENLKTVLDEIYLKNGLQEKTPPISHQNIEEIRSSLEKLAAQWHLLKEGETMTLIFEE